MKTFLKRPRNLFFFWIVFTSYLMPAQQSGNGLSISQATHCGSSWMLSQSDPARLAAFEQGVKNRLMSRSINSIPDTQHYTLPVVYHVIHQNGSENISDADIRAAHQLLNDAFENLAPFNTSTGANINIGFCVGTNAITRHVSPLTSMTLETDDHSLKQLGPWNSSNYINIWIVSSIHSLNMGPAVAGYAMLPNMHGSTTDGIVIEAAFMNNNPDHVKVLVHEMGHYLGLYHTFEGGCVNNDCTTDGDKVCDTPPDNSMASVPCTGTPNTCHTDSDDPSINNPFRSIGLGGLGDQPDMFRNYMDYGFSNCQNTFTDGQRTRMRSSLLNARGSLLNTTNACIQCPAPIFATLHIPDTVAAGVPVTFSLTTNVSSPLIYWTYNNQTVSAQTITTTFPTAGTIPILVYVIDPSATSCAREIRDTIIVTCPVPVPSFSVSPTGLLNPGETVTFTAPNNGSLYTWNIDGVPIGSGSSINYVVNGTHGRLLTLTLSNGTCQANSEPYLIDPGNCNGTGKENNTWYFGENGGISFNTSPPTAIPGKLNVVEGCAVLCDNNGNPVYHSDGEIVGNSQTGLTLLNGSGLSGNATTTQGALFVPRPGSNRYVYLFTVDYQTGDFSSFGGGIHYSIIDRQGNGGQGAVTLKNQLLTAPVVEKMTAVKNLSGSGVWVIAHKWNSNAFYAWQVTAAGVTSPVISTVGPAHNSPSQYADKNSSGEMKASPSGKKLALSLLGQSRTEVYDFNPATGVVSNPVILQNTLISSNYGVAFSPNERFLYVSTVSSGHKVVRFDLSAGSDTAINSSCAVVGSTGKGGGALQLAPNGKIYIARSDVSYLGVISNPNAVNLSSCGYVLNGIRLFGNSRSFFGLPNMVQSILLSVEPNIIGPDKICLSSSSQTFSYSVNPAGRAIYSWIHHGPNAFTPINDSTSSITFNLPGTDTLIVKRTAACGSMYDTLIIHSGPPQPFDIGPDKLVCRGTNVVLDAGPGQYQYNWSNGTASQTVSINAEGKVVATVISTTGCTLKDSLLVLYHTLPSLNLGRDTSLCTNETITLHAPAGMDSYLWSTGATGLSLTPPDSGSYSLTVGKFGCLFKDTIRIRKNLPLNILSKDTFVVCSASNNLLPTPTGFDSFLWTLPNGSTSTASVITLVDPGYYVLNYNNRCGSSKDSIYHYKPRVFLADTIVSCADTVRLISNIPLGAFFQLSLLHNQFHINADTVDVYRSSTYITTGRYGPAANNCYVAQLITVYVDTSFSMPLKTVNLGPDVSYCPGQVLPLNAGSGFDWYRWNTGAADSSTTVYGFGTYSVKAHYCGYDYTDTILVSRDNSLTVSLGNDKFICPGETIQLNAGTGYDWYSWDNGQQSQQIAASSNGQYIIEVGLNGCTAKDTVMIHDAETTFTVSGSSLICPGEILTLTASASPGVQYLWDSLNVQTGGNGNTLQINMPGNYSVKNQNCPSSAWSAPFVVTQETLPSLLVGFVPAMVCPQDSILISFNGNDYTNFYWSDGSLQNPRRFIGAAVPVLVVSGVKCSETHTLSIPLKNSTDCIVGTGIESNDFCKTAYTLVPNPGNDVVKLSVSCPTNKPLAVTLSGAEGKATGGFRGDLNAVNNYLNQVMQQLSPAIYTLKVEDHTGQYYFKWIIIK